MASTRPRRRADRIRFRRCRTRRVVGEIVERLKAQGLHPSPLPLGLRENCVFCNTCNSFPCKIHAKSDADVCGVRPATQSANVTLWINAIARKLITDPSGRKIEAVEIERDGKTGDGLGAAGDRVLRRGELGGAAAAIGQHANIRMASRIHPASSASATWRTWRR